MKNNIYNTLSGFASRIRYAGRVLSVISLLALSSSAWATYFLRLSTNNSTWFDGGSSDNGYFEWDDARFLVTGTDIYVRILHSSDGDWKDTQEWCDGVSGGVAGFYEVSTHTIGDNNCERYAKYRLSVPVGSVRFQYIHDDAHTQTVCSNPSKTVQRGTYNFEFPELTYKLCGGITSWNTSDVPEMTETGTAGVYSTSVFLLGGQNIPSNDSRGFKVAAVSSGGGAVWYGADDQFNYGLSEHLSMTLASTAEGDAGNRCGIHTQYSGTYTFTYNSSSKVLSVTYPDAIEATPIVRWGVAPTKTKNDTYSSEGCDRYDINASAYIASPGCSGGSEQTLDSLKVRLRKKTGDVYTEEEIVKFKRDGGYSRNITYQLVVECTKELLMSCLDETTIYMDVAGHNSEIGWSAYSDEMEIKYQACNKFIIVPNVTKTFTACDGGHQLAISDMAKPVTGTTWTLKKWNGSEYVSVTPSDHFTQNGEVLIWKNTDKNAGEHKYEFTFSKDGFSGDNTSVLTIKYDQDVPSGELTAITAAPSGDVTPWTPVVLSTTIPDASIKSVQWSVSGVPAPILVVGDPTTSATFTAKPFAFPVTYTITAKGLSANCVTTTGVQKTITVNPDSGDGATIILNADAPVVDEGPEVTLSGYVKKLTNNSSTALKKVGFAYKEGSDCGDASSWTKVVVTLDQALKQGESWSATINSGLKTNTTYTYRAYVHDDTGNADYYSVNPNNTSEAACGTFTTKGGCEYPTGDTIYYTIDASLVSESPCHLAFKSFENALANLKSHKTAGAADYWWDNSKMMLVKNVVFQVVPNKAGYGVQNGRVDFSNINKYESSSSPTPTKRLVIRPKVAGTRPIVWGMYLANSRWVTVNSMNIQREAPSSSDGMGHSCVLIGLNDETNNIAVGKMTSTNLVFVNCVFSGDNFCCIHASGVDGLYLEDNNLIAQCSHTSANTRDWGASIKFMNCKNITLLRNNFKGAHSNNIFSQNTRNLLVMNNVFWNANTKFDTGVNNSAIIRLLNFNANDDAHSVKNVGIYYNTLFLQENPSNYDRVDFLIFGGNNGAWNNAARYDESTIEFQYNNCYSYSTTSAGKSENPFLGKTITSTMKYNNFWSANSSAGSGSEFAFGGNTRSVNMSSTGGMICTTTPNTPEGMVIRGSALNYGSRVSEDVSGLGAESVVSDRLDVDIRENVADGSWTYGAYQQRTGETVNKIIWNGGEDADWDNRNNWVKENGRQLTCIDILSDKVMAIIPEPHSHQYPLPTSGSITKYPTIPAWGEPSGEKVRANGNYAYTIEMEYGSAIKGVEELKVGDAYHYYNVQSHLTVDPKEWVLVGSVVRPFKDKDKAMAATPTLPADSATRLTQSGDFYLYHKPHVYMQKFDIAYNSGSVVATWGTPFTDLKTDVEPTETFAISVADQFGDMKLPASFYYAIFEPDPSKLNDGDKQRTFDFNGHYYAAEQALNYTVPATSLGVFNNAYPANIDGTATYSNFNLYTYDYNDKAWEAIGTIEDKMIKPQSGFAIYNTSGSSNTFSPVYVTAVADGKDIDTKYKTAEANAQVIIRAYNLFNDKGSRIGVGEAFNDAYKLFNGSVSENLEVYMLKNDGKYSTLKTDDFNTVIPVGVRNKSNSAYPIRFELIKAEGVESVILEDRGVTPAATYDLLSGEAPAFPSIEPGDLEGRFYLMLGAGTEENPDIPTDAPAESADSLNVDVFVNNGIMTVSVSADAVISNITMYDMAGKAYKVAVNGTNMNKSKLNVAKGVYTVTVVTDKGTETKKIIVK